MVGHMTNDLLRRIAGRAAIALLVLLVGAGTVFAAASRVGDDRTATRHAEATETPKATETPDATEKPEGTEAPQATETPEAAETKDVAGAASAPSDANLARVVARLAAAGIVATPDQLKALATQVGLGGAVRVLAFADASGKTPAEIVALFKTGKGWGVIAKDLKLTIGPGIGRIMGSGHGKGNAAGQGKPSKVKLHGKPSATPAG
jgi:hypothetical protein